MRESNFYFPAHNKASVSITSALYDRRAIDATSPLPLLSTLTHLSYLTSTSPRIREILCSDGGLERLISILRSTGRRMREQRRNLQQQHQSPLSSIPHHPSELGHPISIQQPAAPAPSSSSSQNHSTPSTNLIRVSPFRPFLSPQTTQSINPTTTDSGHLTLQPPTTNNLAPIPTPFPIQPLAAQPTLSTQPLASHQIATLGLTKEQKQLLWTWSLSFQCVVNIGVRGTESIRTRVVEAGVVPVIISVLGGYLHEMERVRQQSENHERARNKAALEAASTGHSRHLVSTSQRAYSLNADLPRPPRPVLSSRTLVQPLPNPSPLPISDLPPRIPIDNNSLSTLPLPSSPSPPLSLTSPLDPSRDPSTAPQSQSSSRSQPLPPRPEQRHSQVDLAVVSSSLPARSNPILIHSAADPVARTGSISPSSVSSSSSLETSRLHLNRRAILRNDSSTSASTLDPPVNLINVDPHENHTDARVGRSSPEPHSSTVVDEIDNQSAADESEADVVMELVGDHEAGPSSGRQRSRRGTIKASQANAHKFVHITPLAPPRPTLTELDHENLPLNPQSQASPMEGLESDVNEGENNAELGNSSNSSVMLYSNHQTPRASSARLPNAGPVRPQISAPHPTVLERAVSSVSEDVPMTASSEATNLTSTSTSESDYSPTLEPNPVVLQTNRTADDGQLTRVLSDTEGMAAANAFAPRPQNALPAVAAAPTVNVVDPTGLNPPTVRPPPPSVGSTSLSSPVNLAFRDEDVLLALQLLAYLSKYAHVRAYFHEPASRSTLELTYGSIHDATRALARFSGRFKSERYERERGKEFVAAAGVQSSSRRPASAQEQHSLPVADPAISPNDLSDRMRGTSSQAHYPHRSYSSSMMRTRMQVEEALEQARTGRVSQDISSNLNHNNGNRAPSSDPGAESLRPALLLGGVTLFSTSPLVSTVPQMLRQPSFVLGQPGSTNLMPGVAPPHGSHYSLSHSSHGGLNPNQAHDVDQARMMYHHQARAQLSNPSSSSTGCTTAINPLASNVFSYVERFTHQRLPHDIHSPTIPGEIQYWAGVIMRNACRKDETRGGIRQCANMQCGRWESVPREFAKCRRCRKAKYCSKNCQSRAWQHGHRFWCSTRAEGEGSSAPATSMGTGEGEVASLAATETPEAVVEDPSRRVDRTSRALVDAAIERLRRTGDGPAGATRRERGDISEVGSNIATPPDREIRVENPLVATGVLPEHDGHIVHHHHHHPGVLITNRNPAAGRGTPGVIVDGVEQLVDERDQIRLMVENPQDDQIINP